MLLSLSQEDNLRKQVILFFKEFNTNLTDKRIVERPTITGKYKKYVFRAFKFIKFEDIINYVTNGKKTIYHHYIISRDINASYYIQESQRIVNKTVEYSKSTCLSYLNSQGITPSDHLVKLVPLTMVSKISK